jgi:hypothetical protein
MDEPRILESLSAHPQLGEIGGAPDGGGEGGGEALSRWRCRECGKRLAIHRGFHLQALGSIVTFSSRQKIVTMECACGEFSTFRLDTPALRRLTVRL